ncbi:CBS domain-containing protein [Methylobacterium sp. NEAU 140]|uniref:CBS domain-containing protein n=1 Tax=Methylobacterium sp. NEAU 140 TaxID=3064945 RepID=UPI002732E386|nr:CBS domain-containing protein [Methylobacterium sp. NEAU 140]MDP4026876.1 CBS domain-containing protein [Methylobacterium sp. NEAU 140]
MSDSAGAPDGIRVSDVMATDVEFIAAEATVQEAATLMGEIEVGALPVGASERIEGVVTDRDILYRLVARGRDPAGVRVREVMSRSVVSCRPTDTVRAAMDLMAANHVRRLAVTGEGGAVVGWLTLADLSRRLLVDEAPVQAALRALTEPPA